MKKTILIVGVTVIAFAFASCSKEYTCDCVTDSSGTTTTTTYTAEFKKKSDAETWCDAGDYSSGTYSTECDLK